MATSRPKPNPPSKPPAAPIAPEPKFSVPGAPRPPKHDLTRAHIHIHGEPKIGKTTLAADADAWIIATERGQDWVLTREPTLINNWTEFLELCGFIHNERPTTFSDGAPLNTLAIDRYDALFKMCEDAVKNDLGVEDLGEMGHGKGWARLTGEFERVMNKVRRWPYGLITISHTRQKEFKSKQTKVDRYEPDIGAAGMRWVLGSADLILYAHSHQVAEINKKTGQVTGKIEEERVVRCHPSSTMIAGGRMAQLLPPLMPLNYAEIKHRIEHPEEYIQEGAQS